MSAPMQLQVTEEKYVMSTHFQFMIRNLMWQSQSIFLIYSISPPIDDLVYTPALLFKLSAVLFIVHF